MYHGYHSIDIYPYDSPIVVERDAENVEVIKMNTWEDFNLVAEERPSVNPPEPKIEKVDVPGRDGAVDYTDSLSGYPSYNNRTGSWDFILVNDFYEPVDTYEAWYNTYTRLMTYIQGQRVKVILEDDLMYYYEGRLYVSKLKSGQKYSTITIEYDFKPYKYSIYTNLNGDSWLWDPFNFTNGVIQPVKFKNLTVGNWNSDSDGYYVSDHYLVTDIKASDVGSAPCAPKVIGTAMLDPRIGMNVIHSFTNSASTLKFKVPGWSRPREYKFNDSEDREFTVPEYTFRRSKFNLDDDAVVGKIRVATKYTKTIAYGFPDNTNAPWKYNKCEECGTDFVMYPVSEQNFGVSLLELAGYEIQCLNCYHTKFIPVMCRCPECDEVYDISQEHILDTVEDKGTYYQLKCTNQSCGHTENRPYTPDLGFVTYELKRGEF